MNCDSTVESEKRLIINLKVIFFIMRIFFNN